MSSFSLHPHARTFVKSPINWVLVLLAAALWAVAWPLMIFTLNVDAVLLPFTAALASWPIALAWYRPQWGWLVSAVSGAAFILAPAHGSWHMGIVHLMVLIVLSVAASMRGQMVLVPVVWTGTAAAYVISGGPGRWAWLAAFGFTAVICCLVRLVFMSHQKVAQQDERLEVVESHKSILEERARIARDLHDIVAHRMSLVVVQAQTAPYRVPDTSPGAQEEFSAIAQNAREALNEVRGILGVLRPDIDPREATVVPNPGIADIDSLVEGTRAAGIDVHGVVTVDPGSVSDATSLVAYRIVQESLANATKYAPGARVDVEVSSDQAVVTISIENSAATAPSTFLTASGGYGLRGMSERARAVGGSVVHGSTPSGGFRVVATLPATSSDSLAAVSGSAQVGTRSSVFA